MNKIEWKYILPKIKSHVPNALTLARLGLIPWLCLSVFNHPKTALILFMVASLTDFLDGFLARRWAVTSTLGTVLDPIADKAQLLATYFTLMILKVAPPLFVGFMLAVVLLQNLGYLLVHFFRKTEILPQPLRISKWATASHMIFLTLAIATLAHAPNPKHWLVSGPTDILYCLLAGLQTLVFIQYFFYLRPMLSLDFTPPFAIKRS